MDKEFEKYVKTIENDETRLLKLQKQYENGQIQEKDLTVNQVNQLSELYDYQIRKLKIENEARKQKLLVFRNKMKNKR